MEYWVPWGNTEVFFEAPTELSVITPSPTPLTDEEISSKISSIPDSRIVLIDYLPPPTVYERVLRRLSGSVKTVYVSSWRLGLERVDESIAELDRLEEKPPLAPFKELEYESQALASAVLLYPVTSRLLLNRFITGPNEYLAWLFRIHDITGFDPSQTSITPVEISYSVDGLVQGISTQNNWADRKTLEFDSVIVSPGKAPLDSNFYMAAQSIILSSNACGEGATLLAVSEGREGLGPPEFVRNLYEVLKSGLQVELSSINVNPYRLVAAELASALRSHRAYLVTSLPRSLARLLLGLKTFETVQEGFTQLLRLHGRSHRMLLVREGLHTDLSTLATG